MSTRPLGKASSTASTIAPSAEAPLSRAATAAANRSAILEFEVDDVDRVLSSLDGEAVVVQGPTVMPWGNRSLLLRDPDGSLVNVFSRPHVAPVAPAR